MEFWPTFKKTILLRSSYSLIVSASLADQFHSKFNPDSSSLCRVQNLIFLNAFLWEKRRLEIWLLSLSIITLLYWIETPFQIRKCCSHNLSLLIDNLIFLIKITLVGLLNRNIQLKKTIWRLIMSTETILIHPSSWRQLNYLFHSMSTHIPAPRLSPRTTVMGSLLSSDVIESQMRTLACSNEAKG